LARSSAYIDELAMAAILLIVFIIFLFAALPTLPYSASGRARYHVVSVGERTARVAKRPRLSTGEAPHKASQDYASRFRELQSELQNALDRQAEGWPRKLELSKADRFTHDREQRAA
jgi:hypothetical protein